jgi:hypothetical protein
MTSITVGDLLEAYVITAGAYHDCAGRMSELQNWEQRREEAR